MGDEFLCDGPPHWEVSFLVDDGDAFIEQAQTLGGTPLGLVEDAAIGSGALRSPIRRGPRSPSCRSRCRRSSGITAAWGSMSPGQG